MSRPILQNISISLPSTSEPLTFTYIDSGVPSAASDKPYTTVVFLHGFAINASLLEPLFPLAQQNNLRIVSVNRRGYNGTTPHSDEELHEEGFLKKQCGYLVLVLDALIKSNDLGGGFALCGWSRGTIFALGILEVLESLDNDLVSKEVKERVGTAMKAFLIWDPVVRTLGIPIPSGCEGYDIEADPTIPKDDLTQLADNWATGYFQHDESLPHTFAKLSQRTPLSSPPPSLSIISEPEKLHLTKPTAPLTIEQMCEHDNAIYQVPDDFSQLRQKYLEGGEGWKGKRYLLYGSQSTWSVVWVAWWLENQTQAKSENGELVLRRMEGGNHMMAWDMPAEFIEHLKWCIRDAAAQ
ncbi:Alpha/Beta hydrolase protein [Flagelloscypha sp. PMI_526]|nr:Alpha/Beta hydrolase protein [Flagelloscypha sp. PMI_526]